MSRNSAEKQKYESLLARCREMESQKQDIESQLTKTEEKYSTLNDAVRKLCETLLSKDREEMKLGGNYNWRGIDTLTLIIKAAASDKKFNAERVDLMKRIMDLAENRLNKIESLEDQVKRELLENERLRARLSGKAPAEPSDAEELPENPLESSREQAPNVSAKVLPKEQKAEKAMPEAPHSVFVIDENDDLGIISQAKELMDLSEQTKVTNNTIPIFESRKVVERKKREKKEAIDAHLVNLKDFESRLSEEAIYVLDCIGTDGISIKQTIEKEILIKHPDLTKHKIRIGMITLQNMGAVEESRAVSPLYPNRHALRLTAIGGKLYKNHFGKEAVLSELEKVIAEHDNAEHGYGILDVGSVLEASGNFETVSVWNRKNAIKLDKFSTYVPDIIATSKKHTEYIEYERGTHTQEDFNAKCNKMCKVTKFLHFVVPNNDVLLNRIMPQLEAWMKERGDGSLTGVVVRVSTAKYLRDNNPGTRDCWQVVYKDGKTQPVVCNVKNG